MQLLKSWITKCCPCVTKINSRLHYDTICYMTKLATSHLLFTNVLMFSNVRYNVDTVFNIKWQRVADGVYYLVW